MIKPSPSAIIVLCLGLGAFLNWQLGSNVVLAQSPTPVEDTETMKLNLNVGAYIGFDCEDSVEMILYGYGSTISSIICSVLTNNPTGYEIAISSITDLSDGSTGLIPKLAGPAVLQQSASGVGWAINGNSAATATSATWVTSGVLWTGSEPTPADGEDHTVNFGLSAGQLAIPAEGNYLGTVVFTATAL